MATKRVVSWMAMLLLLVSAWYVAVAWSYARGASGARIGRVAGDVDFQRELDWQLYELAHGYGLMRRVGDSSGWSSLVRLQRSAQPFRTLCGQWQSGEEIIPAVSFRQGDWLYQQWTHPGRPAAWNLATGEVVMAERLTVPDYGSGAVPSPADEPVFGRLGLSFADANRISFVDLARYVRPVPTFNDSCYVVHMSFWALYVLVLLGGLGVVVVSLVRRRRER